MSSVGVVANAIGVDRVDHVMQSVQPPVDGDGGNQDDEEKAFGLDDLDDLDESDFQDGMIIFEKKRRENQRN